MSHTIIEKSSELSHPYLYFLQLGQLAHDLLLLKILIKPHTVFIPRSAQGV